MNSAEQAISVSALRMQPPFTQTSRRLLADLIAGGEIIPLTSEDFLYRDLDQGRMIVLEGTLIATRKRDSRTEFSVKDVGRVFSIGKDDVGANRWTFRAATEVGHCRILYVPDSHIREILRASPFMAISLGEDEANRLAEGEWSPYPLTLVCAAPDISVPLEALTFLLAAAVLDTRTPAAGGTPATKVAKNARAAAAADESAGDPGTAAPAPKGVAVIRCSATPAAWVLVGDKYVKVKRAELATWLARTTLEESRRNRPPSKPKDDGAASSKPTEKRVFPSLGGHELAHAFFVNEERPLDLPKDLRTRKFHQIIYVAAETLREIPYGLERRLFQFDLLGDGESAGFNAFVPTVLVDVPREDDSTTRPNGKKPTRWPKGNTSAAPAKRRPNKEFRVAEVFCRDTVRIDQGSEPGWSSLERDSCTLRLDLAAVEDRWRGARHAISAFKDEKGEIWASAQRWARAVTNCQVGVVLSGGGASAFRAYALLQTLENSGIPVDVIGGVSGGALVAAYYAKNRMKGFDQCFASAGKFQRAGLLSAISSRFIQDQVDGDLGKTRVEDLEIRLAAVAGAAPEDGAPRGVVITHGTLGEAVRASGSLPLGYGPTLKGGYRYADGATASPVPVDVVRNLGADVIIAFNCIPGPDRGNPFNESFAGRLLYRHTVVGRLIDAWVAMAFMLQQSIRLAMSTADVRLEPKATERPLLEMLDWRGIRRIARRSWEEDGEEIQHRVDDLAELWTELRTGVSIDGVRQDTKKNVRPRDMSSGANG